MDQGMTLLNSFTLLFLSFFVFVNNSSSASDSKNGVSLGLGLLAHRAGKVTNNATKSSKPLFTEVYSDLALEWYNEIDTTWGISTQLNYTPIAKKSPDGGEKTRVYSAALRVHQSMADGADVHLGPGMMFYQISGSGGTITLNNGSGTLTFGLPSTTTTSRISYLDLGASWVINEMFQLEAAVLMSGLVSSKRAFHPFIEVSGRIF